MATQNRHKKPKKTTTKVVKFCFTLNNYTEEEYQQLIEFGRNKCKFVVIGKEVSSTGTPHLQGYANLVKQSRFSAIKKIMPKAHLEVAQGTDEQNLKYCTKTDKEAFIWGEPQRCGKRNDIKKATDMVLEKKTLPEIAVAAPEVYVKYFRGIQALTQIVTQPRDINDPPTTIWLWGASGVGKTRFAYDNFAVSEIYMKDGTQWWDGYMQQQCILIDDFDGKWPFRDFLRVTDRYPYKGQTKGGYVTINSSFIIITCEFEPKHFWVGNDLIQVERRFQFITHLT